MNLTEKLYALNIPEVRRVFLEAIADIVDSAVLSEIEKAVESNDIEGVLKACGYNQAVFNRILDALDRVYQKSAEQTVNEWPKRIGFVRPVFNMRTQRVTEDLQTFSSSFISRIDAEIRENVRNVLADGLSRGVNPKTTALELVGRYDPTTKKRVGGFIGLSQNQTSWVLNARNYLETLDSRYLKLGLRDKRFDKLVVKAIAEKKPLSKSDIEKMITAYKSKCLKYRADTIARTETIQSINRGKTAAISQGIDEGLFRKDQVTKWWDDTGDGRTRKSHRHLGTKYGRKNAIPFDEAFITLSGDSLRFPGDFALGADASEIIHCRCGVQYHVDFVNG